MKVVIFAGGLGTRLMEETEARPKPMVEIGGKPILWHIMKIYDSYGFDDFVICLGYKAYYTKQYFLNYYLHNSDVSIELGNNNVEVHYSKTEKFKVTLVDTGLETGTAGRLKKVQKYLGNEDFLLTYGDGVADINLDDLIEFHKKSGKMVTLTAVQPEARFGGLNISNSGVVDTFKEKPVGDGVWINGGFFVLSARVFDYLKEVSDEEMWEESPLESLTKDNELMAYKHHGFWKCMDALRDKIELDELWNNDQAKWKVW